MDKLRLDGIFSDGMIFRRDAENEIWGFDALADSVTAELDGIKVTAKTENGHFRIKLPPHSAASGLTLTVTGSSAVTLSDICFGDLLLLTGQSNMELPVGRTLDVSPDAVNDSFPYIRQFSIRPLHTVGYPAGSIPENRWIKAQGADILLFSAAGYFAARRIYLEKGVPVGLILAAQGGSTIESWMPEEELSAFGDYTAEIDRYRGDTALGEAIAQRDREIAQWKEKQDMHTDEGFSSRIPDGAKEYFVPGFIRDTELRGFSGSVWFYKEVVLDDVPEGGCLLRVGDLIDSDRTYVNGVKVGETGYRYPPRKYRFASDLLHPGSNLIAVRLIIDGGDGGFVPAHPYRLELNGKTVDLSGEWKYAVEHRAETPSPTVVMAQCVPTWLYNGSIAPLAGLSFSGTFWYQGESNADAPERYDEKFTKMLRCWRKTLRQPLPAICVEMCDYIEPLDPTGEESPEGWAKIQQMQRTAPQTVENCRCVSAKDLGETLELHPQKKEELGERLAKEALSFFEL